MQAVPYVLIRAEVLDQVLLPAEQALQAWCEDWGVAREDVTLECLRAWDGAAQLPAATVWRRSWRKDTRALALTWSGELPALVQRLLYAPDRQYAPSGGSAVTAVAAGEAAWQQLLQGLGMALIGGEPAPAAAQPPASDWRYASGAVMLVIHIGRQACHALLNHDAVQALAHSDAQAASARLPALDFARLLAPLPVRLPVPLGAADVDLGSLMRLQIGDVIRLDTVADRALRVAGPSGAALFDGYLGRAGEALALELAPLDTTNGVQHEQ